MRRRPGEMMDRHPSPRLDAMGNAFGAVVFMALLLAVLCRADRPRPQPSDALTRAAVRRAGMLEERLRLMEEERLLAQASAAGDAAATLAASATRDRLRERAAEDRRRRDRERGALERERAAIVAATENRRRQLAALDKRREALRADLAEARAASPSSPPPEALRQYVHPPAPPRSGQYAWFVIFRWNRAFPVLRTRAGGGVVENDEAVAFAAPSGSTVRLTPLEGKGFTPFEAGQPSDGLKRLLGDVRRHDRYVYAWVYGDSYPAYLQTRALLEKENIRYEWRPMAPRQTLALEDGIGVVR